MKGRKVLRTFKIGRDLEIHLLSYPDLRVVSLREFIPSRKNYGRGITLDPEKVLEIFDDSLAALEEMGYLAEEEQTE